MSAVARVPPVEPDGAEPPAARLLERIAGERGRAFNVYRTLAHSPGALEHVYGLATWLWHESSLPARVQELVILRVAQLTGCDYEWSRHLPLARQAGLNQRQLEALAGRDAANDPCFDIDEQAALVLTDEATLRIEASERAVAAVRERLGERGVVELLLLIGFYGAISRLLRSLAVQAEPGDLPMPRSGIEQQPRGPHYVRIYAEPDGESHLEDVMLPSTVRDSPVSSAKAWLTAPLPATAAIFRRVVSEHPAEPHRAPRRQLLVHLRGQAEIEVSDGERRLLGPGSVALVEDLAGKGHVTRRIGGEARETLVIWLDGPDHA